MSDTAGTASSDGAAEQNDPQDNGPKDPIVAAAQEQLRPHFDAVIAQLDDDAAVAEMTFFTTNLIALLQASEPIDIGELFLQLSTTAFMGFEFSPVQAQLVDELLAQAEQLAHLLSADSNQAH